MITKEIPNCTINYAYKRDTWQETWTFPCNNRPQLGQTWLRAPKSSVQYIMFMEAHDLAFYSKYIEQICVREKNTYCRNFLGWSCREFKGSANVFK